MVNINMLHEMIDRAMRVDYTSNMTTDQIKIFLADDLNVKVSVGYIKWVLKQLQRESIIIQVSLDVWSILISASNYETKNMYDMMKRRNN